MRRHRTNLRHGLRRGSRHTREQGVVITLVAVFMLVVIGAMAALSIDVVTFYTARSEAQLAADSAALAGARVLANSGATSDTTGASMNAAWTTAVAVATQVAKQNQVGGTNVTAAEVSIPAAPVGPNTNPTFTVILQNIPLPIFFARMLGTTPVTVTTKATAEAYNPSGTDALGSRTIPVAPICVKPWLLPNLDPTQAATGTAPIFTRTTGAIAATGLVGHSWPPTTFPDSNPNGLFSLCSDCSPGALPGGLPSPVPGQYYPGDTDPTDFPPPTAAQGLPTCSGGFNSYQLAVAGCVQQPVSCRYTLPAAVNIDVNPYATNRDSDTVTAAQCLIHSGAAGDSDSIDPATTLPPFRFVAGNQNPVASSIGNPVMVSDSLVTIPVIDYPGTTTPPTTSAPSVNIIGFLQVFLNPSATGTLPFSNGASPNQIPATVINMAGCGTGATGQAILGNGASPVAVRLISSP